MQLYKVKLNEGHTAKPEQISGGYLGNYEDINVALYTKSEATKKAKMFGGKIEKHGKNYTAVSMKVLQLSKQEISPAVINQLNGREVFQDTDTAVGEIMYYGDVFDAVLGEQGELSEILCLNEAVLDELNVLNNLSYQYAYIMFV
jgi:hypothetical protein